MFVSNQNKEENPGSRSTNMELMDISQQNQIISLEENAGA